MTCGDGVRTRTRSCSGGCSTPTAKSLSTLESESCDMGGPCSSPCINYKTANQCGNSGDLIGTTSITTSLNVYADTAYGADGEYGSCASLCVGTSECVQFDWIQLGNDGSGTCHLFSSG